MSDQLNSDGRLLAAEFALGVLSGERLRRARERFDHDIPFRHEVERWQEDLSGLTNEYEAVEPSPSVWAGIEQEIFGSSQTAPNAGLWHSLRFWRTTAMATSLAAVVAAAALVVPRLPGHLQTNPAAPSLIASLHARGEAPFLIAQFQPAQKQLIVRISDGGRGVDETRVPELWIIPGDAVPRSLGVLARSPENKLKLENSALDLFVNGATLAISLEPEGGSPTGAPTGPVIASGKLSPL